MPAPFETVTQFQGDVAKAHQWVHGPASGGESLIETESGPRKTLGRLASEAEAQLLGVYSTLTNTEVTSIKAMLDRMPSRNGRLSFASSPNLAKTLYTSLFSGVTHTLPFFGSSVSLLEDTNGNTPGDVLTLACNRYLGLGDYPLHTFETGAYGHGGDAMSDFPTQWADYLADAKPSAPLSLDIFGMNCFQTAHIYAGQTLPGFITNFVQSVRLRRDAGMDVWACTSPHPRIMDAANAPKTRGLNPILPAYWPTPYDAPVDDETELVPPRSQSVITADFLGDGTELSALATFLIGNQVIRWLGYLMSVPVLDCERSYFEAMGRYKLALGTQRAAEQVIYGDDTVAPTLDNDLHPVGQGMLEIYSWPIMDAVAQVAQQGFQHTPPARLGGKYAINGEASTNLAPNVLTPPDSYWDHRPYYGDETTAKLFSYKVNTGAADGAGKKAAEEALYLSNLTGELVALKGITSPRHKLSSIGSVGNTAGPVSITPEDGTCGFCRIFATQGGIGKSHHAVDYVRDGSTVGIGTVSSSYVGGDPVSTITASGDDIVVALDTSSTNINWAFDEKSQS